MKIHQLFKYCKYGLKNLFIQMFHLSLSGSFNHSKSLTILTFVASKSVFLLTLCMPDIYICPPCTFRLQHIKNKGVRQSHTSLRNSEAIEV